MCKFKGAIEKNRRFSTYFVEKCVQNRQKGKFSSLIFGLELACFHISANLRSILISFERGNTKFTVPNCLAGYACLIFFFSHHGTMAPWWPLRGPPGRHCAMMGEKNNQACEFLNTPPNNGAIGAIFLWGRGTPKFFAHLFSV